MANGSQVARLIEIDAEAKVARQKLSELEKSAATTLHVQHGNIDIADFIAGGSDLETLLERLGHSGSF